MTVGSLFSGIGGFDLGLERAGMVVKWQVERDPWCQKILATHWPDVPRYGDITTLTGNELTPVDLICGGFPCQPVSIAGHQKGTDDDRWLWPEFRRIVGLLRPRYVLVENVPGLFTANGGHAFGEVIGDLADLGYDCEWTVLSAADVGAPHLRKRVWIVAHADCNDRGDRSSSKPPKRPTRMEHRGGGPRQFERKESEAVAHADADRRDPNSDGQGRESRSSFGSTVALGERRVDQRRRLGQEPGMADATGIDGERPERGRSRGRQSELPAGDSGRGRGDGAHADSHWTTEPDVGRVANGVPHRVDRLKGLGNAIVPQCAEWIGRRLLI